MRAASLLNRLLGFAGTVVTSFSQTASTLVVEVALRSKVLVCPCGRTSRARYDKSRRSWRHINLGTQRVVIEAEIRRVDCRGCGQIRTEWVPWARPGMKVTRDFEDMAGWLSARMSKTAVATFLQTSFRTVHAIVERLVGAHLDTDRLTGLYRIGVDEISYKKGRRFLTVIANHDTGKVLWVGEGRSIAVFGQFIDQLDQTQQAQISHVSMDMSGIYREAVRTYLPQATICFDPFHVITWAGEAVNSALHATNPKAAQLGIQGLTPSKAWGKIRATLRTAAEDLDALGQQIITQIRKHYPRLHRAWSLKEELRQLYRTVPPAHAARYLTRWTDKALRSDIPGCITLARRIRRNFDGIIAAVHNGLSNSLVEGLNAGIRLIQRRAHGYAKLDNLITMIYLCHGLRTKLPTETS